MILQGWQKVTDTTFHSYLQRSKELTIHNDCILWGSQVVIPEVVRDLRKLFAIHGIAEIVVSDNGTAFTSIEFSEFMARNGIQHLRTAPYHLATKSLAERAVGLP